MATMSEVARMAGVSITTVSHVINQTRKVAPTTEEQVRHAMTATGYRHNLTARALARQSTDTVGLAMSVVTNPYFGELVRGIEQQLRRAGFTLVLADTNDDPAVAMDVIDHLVARQVSGLIVNPLEGSAVFRRQLTGLLDDGLPLVCLDRRSTLACDQVYSECEQAMAQLTTHLHEHGHRRIGLVAGTATSMSAQDRLNGYRTAGADLGLIDDPNLVIRGESDQQIAMQQVLAHLRGPDPATALVVVNNQMSIGTLRAIKECGLRVPDDVALVCYDDFEWADLFEPQITARAQDVGALAARTVELLLARIADPSRTPEVAVIPTSFQHRHSCGCTND